MTTQDLIDISGSIILCFGSSSLILIGLSTWLGKIWASRILEKDKLKYGSELEEVKKDYQKELEAYKGYLEKSKSLFIRYSGSQFDLYNGLWGTLCKLKETVNDLWEQADFKNLRSFLLHFEKTIKSVEKSRLLIEDEHYDKLKDIFDTLTKFKVNKDTIIKLRSINSEEIQKANSSTIQLYVEQNKESKEAFEKLLEVIAKDFKKQIKLV